MKKTFTLLTFTLSVLWAAAQEKAGKITGTVTDATGKPLEAATVQLLKAEKKALVKAVVTNKEGVYEITQLAAGKYIVSVTAVGFTATSSTATEISSSKTTIAVPVIRLTATSTELKAVTVIAQKPLIEQKMDRTIINVDAAPTNAGATAMEVLEKSPGVTVNNDGVISLKGKQGVIVMMDGKPTYLSPADLANVLKNLPASAIEQIEIMTNPSSKYDASGNSGIINIKTKKSKTDGFNGSITGGGTVGMYRRDNKWLYPVRQNTSVNLNYHKGKVNLFGSANYNHNEGKSDLVLTRNFFDKTGALNAVSNGVTKFNFGNNNYTLKTGIDYYADKKNVFGVVFTGFAFFGHPTPNSTQTLSNPDGSVQSVLQTLTQNKLIFHNYSANANYKHSFDSAGRELTVDLDYIGYNNTSKTLLATDVFDANNAPAGNLTLRGNAPGIINIYSAKADYTHPFKKDLGLDAGIKISYVSNNNQVVYDRDNGMGTWVPDDRSNQFLYDENINAAYVNMNKKWDKWSVQAGLRVENTNAKGRQVTTDSSFTRSYTDLFPTLFLNYEANKNNTFTFSYGRRIDRPNYQDLNPFLWFLDSLSYRQGNPYLLPQYSNNFELRHTLKGGLSTSINYTITDDVMSEIVKQNTDTRISYLTTDNVARFRNVGIAVNAPVKLTGWWKANVFVNVFNNQYTGSYFNSFTGKNDPLDVAYTSFNINISNSFTFKKGWSGELSGFYNAKGVDELSISEPYYSMSLGAQKTLLKGKGTLRINLRDPFQWQEYKASTVYSDIDLHIYNRWNNRSLTVSLSYRFGKSTVPPVRKRSNGASDEQNRVGGQQ
ncbi:MAG TPA: TonB-dependent receptor [Chitinophagaceae bacterium]